MGFKGAKLQKALSEFSRWAAEGSKVPLSGLLARRTRLEADFSEGFWGHGAGGQATGVRVLLAGYLFGFFSLQTRNSTLPSSGACCGRCCPPPLVNPSRSFHCGWSPPGPGAAPPSPDLRGLGVTWDPRSAPARALFSFPLRGTHGNLDSKMLTWCNSGSVTQLWVGKCGLEP